MKKNEVRDKRKEVGRKIYEYRATKIEVREKIRGKKYEVGGTCEEKRGKKYEGRYE